MPNTDFLELIINNVHVDLGSLEDLGFKYTYKLEEPESFMSKQGAEPQSIVLPASKANDQVFNTFHNPQVEDLSPGGADDGLGVFNVLAGGTGYIVGDTFYVNGGTISALCQVTAVAVGVVLAGIAIMPGAGYIVGSTHTTTTVTGVGTGLTITVNSVVTNSASSFRELMPCLFNVNGTIPLLKGYALLTDCSFTEKPESYDLTIYSANGLWVIDMQNITMWDCVNPAPHNFTVAVIEASWTNFNTAGDGSDDYVYAPVRYRQPFDGTTLGYQGDNCVNIYHLRPSISLYWLIYRAFKQLGYTIKSQFFTTAYFQGLVLPWVFGDFYDINSQLVQGVCFKAAGILPTASEPPPIAETGFKMWSGNGSNTTFGTVGGSAFWNRTINGGWDGGGYSPGSGLVASIGNGIIYITIIGTVRVVVPGSGYLIGDTFTIDNLAGTHATGTVLTVSGTGVLTVTLTFPGDTSSQGYAAGNNCPTTATSGGGSGMIIHISTNSSFFPASAPSPTSNYVFFNNGTSGTNKDIFDMSISTPPSGADNFTLYSFNNSTGTMTYRFSPPLSLAGSMTNVSITFVLQLYFHILVTGSEGTIGIECLHTLVSGEQILTCQSTYSTGGAVVGSSAPDGSNYPSTPTAFNFTVSGCNPGDRMDFRIVCLQGSGTGVGIFGVFSGVLLNNNPANIGVPSYAYNPQTQQFGFITPNSIWSPLQSSLAMTGFLIRLGNAVSLQGYDAFRNFQMLDLLGGVIDMFNLEVQTDNINKTVTIEPMFGSTLPTTETADGYFSLSRILDYSNKRDYSQGKGGRMSLFNASDRQIDLTFKLDSNDGAQNIWGLRYKGIYLNRRTYTGGVYQNNINIDNGIIAGIPGSARYMLPNRFAKGNKQMQNRFFSAVMHCQFPQWINVDAPTTPTSPAPQLICIFPEQGNSADSYAQSFVPKLAWYAGNGRAIVSIGGWIWIGNPGAPYSDAVARGFTLPQMFAVNYGAGGLLDPVLSYSDENILGVQKAGLMTQFYLRRFAIMRNGQLLTINLRLNLNDVCNWTHQECIMIDGCLYALIEIDSYDPLTDTSTPCKMWKVVAPQQIDKDNSFPSTQAILTQPLTLTDSNDVRYHQLLIYSTDAPQIS